MYKVPEAEKHAHKENPGSWSTSRQGEVRSLQPATVTRVALRQARMTQPHSGLYRLPARGLHKVPSHTLELVGGRGTRLFQGWEPWQKGRPGVSPVAIQNALCLNSAASSLAGAGVGRLRAQSSLSHRHHPQNEGCLPVRMVMFPPSPAPTSLFPGAQRSAAHPGPASVRSKHPGLWSRAPEVAVRPPDAPAQHSRARPGTAAPPSALCTSHRGPGVLTGGHAAVHSPDPDPDVPSPARSPPQS